MSKMCMYCAAEISTAVSKANQLSSACPGESP